MHDIGPKIIENLSIKIKINRNNNLILTTVYAPPSNREKFEKEFDELFQKLELSNTKNYYIIAGDLNAKHKRWKNNSYNTRGNQIDKWLEKNDLKYRIQLYNTDIPTYPRGESYLDICIADQRLHFQTINNNELRAIPYDSDHNAVLMDIKNTLDSDWTLETNTETHKKNFNKTNWEKFKKTLIQQHKKKIPDNINLSRNEIDSYIEQLEKEINDTIEKVVPIIKKNKCQTDCYKNKKIKNLEKYKSSIITNINKIYRAMNNKNNHYILRMKIILKEVRKELKQEYKNSINKYWREKIKSITSNNSKKMFPIINQIFRPKGKIEIADLQIEQNKIKLMTESNINVNECQKNENGDYFITETKQKLAILGKHFEAIYEQNSQMGKPGLKAIVNETTNKIEKEMKEEELKNSTITTNRPNTEHSSKKPTKKNNKRILHHLQQLAKSYLFPKQMEKSKSNSLEEA
ncbi:hypothetical protein PV328_012052 [Microctonus aethiopoides]|uniref:Endonuclease/exonuclease/phosphatase domain-containing protein n=1 Tax=Microctonus aethiopoides TaxID=144406 RepID=A0AA39KPU3_9HYME|nr:hypothetical protein PV328_012052 [Microctonus aethiopoides]